MVMGIGYSLFEGASHRFNQGRNVCNFKLRARRLTETSEKAAVEIKGFQGGLQGVLVDGAVEIEAGKYYQPKSKNFFCHLMDLRGRFSDHLRRPKCCRTLVYKVVDKVGKKEGGKGKIFFAVPQQHVDQRTNMQTVQPQMGKIEQWVVCFEKSTAKRQGLKDELRRVV